MLLSGMQHYVFCRRQWALITLEGIWDDNEHTVAGNIVHERAHNDKIRERKNADLFVIRGLRVTSHKLCVTGVCDVVEFHRDDNGVPIYGEDGLWQPYIVEYKRGAPKEHSADEVQLCAQAICLEEMLGCHVTEGALYYAQPARRTAVSFDEGLRLLVDETALGMQDLAKRGYTPKAVERPHCRGCSIREQCLPTLAKRRTVREYMRQMLEAENEAD